MFAKLVGKSQWKKLQGAHYQNHEIVGLSYLTSKQIANR